MISSIPIFEISDVLENLIDSCETRCMVDCCGLDAFNFSPLNIAHFFTLKDLKLEIETEEDMNMVKLELNDILSNIDRSSERKNDEIGIFAPLQRPITNLELLNTCEEIMYNLGVARELILMIHDKRYDIKKLQV